MPINPSSMTRWRKRLVKTASNSGLKIKQSCLRVGRRLVMKASR
jgi:hypothetical protein